MTAQSRPREGPSCEVEMKMEMKDDGVVMKANMSVVWKLKLGWEGESTTRRCGGGSWDEVL